MVLTAAVLLVVSMLAPASLAAVESTTPYVVVVSTTLYETASTSYPIMPLPKGETVQSTETTWAYNSNWKAITYGSHSGYTQNNKIVPKAACYRVSTSSYLYVGAGTGGYAYSSPLPVGTYLYRITSSGSYYKVRAYIGGSTYIGYILKAAVTLYQ